MKIGVLGSGDVAKTLASGLLKHSHEVTIGSRTPEKLAEWATANPKGATGTFAAAAAFGELVVLAVKGNAASSALRAAGANNLAGKTVVDATNPIEDAPPENPWLKIILGVLAAGLGYTGWRIYSGIKAKSNEVLE